MAQSKTIKSMFERIRIHIKFDLNEVLYNTIKEAGTNPYEIIGLVKN